MKIMGNKQRNYVKHYILQQQKAFSFLSICNTLRISTQSPHEDEVIIDVISSMMDEGSLINVADLYYTQKALKKEADFSF